MFRGIKSFLSGNYRVDLKTQQIQYFMIFLLGLYHFVMIVLYFTLFGMNPMSMVNILSVLIYFLCYFSAKKKKYELMTNFYLKSGKDRFWVMKPFYEENILEGRIFRYHEGKIQCVFKFREP